MSELLTDDWHTLARNMLRAELVRRGLSYAGLVVALRTLGVEETEAAIKNKVSRGRFPLTFFLQVMTAIGAEWIQVPGAAALARGEQTGQSGAQPLTKTKKEPFIGQESRHTQFYQRRDCHETLFHLSK